MLKKINRDIPQNHQKLISFFSIFTKKLGEKNFLLKEGMKILIVYPRRIGDCVMLLPFLQNLRESRRNLNITILGPKYFKEIMNNQNLYDKFIDFGKSAGPVSGREWIKNFKDIEKAYRNIKNEKFDIAIEPFGDAFATIYMRRFKADNYVGVNIGNLKKCLNYAATYNDDKHITFNCLTLLKEIGGKVEEKYLIPKIIPTMDWKEKKDQYIKDYNLDEKLVIGIHCGASIKIKQWQGYSELVKLLLKKYKSIFIIFFADGQNDKQIKTIIESSKLVKENYIIIQKKLREYIDSLNLCDYIISNDSSCGHLAAAQGIDVTVIYGPYLPVMGTPQGESKITLISKELECKPCRSFQCKFGEEDIKCLKKISAKEVLDEVSKDIEENYKKLERIKNVNSFSYFTL